MFCSNVCPTDRARSCTSVGGSSGSHETQGGKVKRRGIESEVSIVVFGTLATYLIWFRAPTLDIISRAISNIEAGALVRRDQMNALSERLDAILPEDDDDLSEELPPKLAQGKKRRAFEREDTPLREILTRPTITPRVA